MSSSYGKNLRLTIFGQSHGAAVGMTLEGIPAGSEIDFQELSAFLARRAPGRNPWSTPRKEPDEPEFLSGFVGNVSCGAPICAVIRNSNAHPDDYRDLSLVPRPGHADYTAEIKYFGFQDRSGGGHFSGRLTAPLCIAGGIAKQLLEKEGIRIMSRIYSIGEIPDEGELTDDLSRKAFPTVSDEAGKKMIDLIGRAAAQGDSVGGIAECVCTGVPAGLGDPMFDGMENRISQIAFGIPAVKGIEFGLGFEASKRRGSQNNDPFEIIDGKLQTKTNNAGGILGGITNGMPLVFRLAVKPTPSIAVEQESVRLDTKTNETLTVRGRHDPCIVPRLLPCAEAAAAVAILDAYLQRRSELYGKHGPEKAD
ncbi:MAG: chorismate synthase [Clostridia bacterium]|nr:chorismate synthase [Clostridia bacterium]